MVLARSWAEQQREETLEPARPICDPHHHFWTHREGRHLRDRRYLLDDLLADIGSGHAVVSTVFVEARTMYRGDGPETLRPVGETEFVSSLTADPTSTIRPAAGIVGHAKLSLGDGVREVLEAHIAAGDGRFRGIRDSAAWDESPDVDNALTEPGPRLYRSEAFRRGFAHLAPLGLSFDAWLYHPQLDDVIDLARAFPETTIILNHIGCPLGIGPYRGRREEIVKSWKGKICALSTCPNVVVKVGGLQMQRCGFDWYERDRPPTSAELAEATAPYYEHVIETFGARRAMFESNFPVDRLSCSYHTLWNSFKRIASGLSPEDKANLFHDTAARVYRL